MALTTFISSLLMKRVSVSISARGFFAAFALDLDFFDGVKPSPTPGSGSVGSVAWPWPASAAQAATLTVGTHPAGIFSSTSAAAAALSVTSQKQPASINQPAPINKPQPASINTPVSTSLPPIYIYICVATPGRCCALPLTFHPLLALRMQSWWPQGLTMSLKS